jgi:hypothetical protein
VKIAAAITAAALAFPAVAIGAAKPPAWVDNCTALNKR